MIAKQIQQQMGLKENLHPLRWEKKGKAGWGKNIQRKLYLSSIWQMNKKLKLKIEDISKKISEQGGKERK